MKKTCAVCAKTLKRGARYCSMECTGLARAGEKHHLWKGGRILSHGYVLIYKPDHPNCDGKGYVSEHRLVKEKELGRLLKNTEVVHHINKDKADNSIENLRVMTVKGHDVEHRDERVDLLRKYHGKGDLNPYNLKRKSLGFKELSCEWCKESFKAFPYSPKKNTWKWPRFCSNGCRAKNSNNVNFVSLKVERTIKCTTCGKEFTATGNYRQKYCSSACEQRSFYWRHKEVVKTKCAECGDIFEAVNRKDQKYCVICKRIIGNRRSLEWKRLHRKNKKS